MTGPSWVSACLDLPADGVDRGTEFWQGVTGFALSAPRGSADEFATLVPPDGDDYLGVQRLGDGPGRLHLDLHVDNPTTAAEAAVELGAHVVVRHESGYVVLRSPGGFSFCFVRHRFVRHRASARPRPVTWPDGTRSAVDQVCLDLPPGLYDAELAFWRTLTGWELHPSISREFARLLAPASMPLRWLVQRLDEPAAAVSAHLDLACDDRGAETARHVALGATVARVYDDWTVLTDPVGTPYCITDRTP